VWLEKKRRIGVTAGASTPDESIDEVVSELNKRVERGKQV
jgi:4-hydroxy-3-methylbut-2-enyl diphosphate reductase IspH